MKSVGNKKQTKFIASLKDSKKDDIEELAKILDEDGIDVEQVSSMLGYITGKAKISIEELQKKYESRGLNIEPDREVRAK